ncbi:hypothetical protein X801_03067, partial [Opisthorchis viverrini]
CDRRIPICVLPFTKDLRTFLSYYHTYVGFGLGNIFEAMSSWITVLICIERYVIMRWPHLGKLHFSRRAARCQIICTICFVILFHLPMFFALKIERGEFVTGNNTSKRYLKMGMTWFGHSMYYYIITWVRFICIQCIPLALLCVVNLRLLILIWSNYRKQRMHSVHIDNGDDMMKREEFLSSIIEHQSEIVTQLSPDYADRERSKGYRAERVESLQVPRLCPVGSNHLRKHSSSIPNAAFYGSSSSLIQQGRIDKKPHSGAAIELDFQDGRRKADCIYKVPNERLAAVSRLDCEQLSTCYQWAGSRDNEGQFTRASGSLHVECSFVEYLVMALLRP